MPSPSRRPPTSTAISRSTCVRRGVHILVEKPIASDRWRRAAPSSPRHGAPASRSWSAMSSASIRRSRRSRSRSVIEDILSIAITRVGPFPPRMSNVGVVIDLAVHDIDLIRWFTDSDIVEVQPQLSNASRGARGHRVPAVPHRLGRACAHQHQLAHPVQGAQRPCGDAGQIHHGRSVDAAGHRVFRLPARRQLFDAASCRSAMPSRCVRKFKPSSTPSAAASRRR